VFAKFDLPTGKRPHSLRPGQIRKPTEENLPFIYNETISREALDFWFSLDLAHGRLRIP